MISNLKIVCKEKPGGMALPLFTLDGVIRLSGGEYETLKDVVMKRIDNTVRLTIAYALVEAIINNKVYAPNGTVNISKVWNKPCERNKLPLFEFVALNKKHKLRCVENPVVIIYTDRQDGFEKYNDYLWFKIEEDGDVVYFRTNTSFVISSETDQSQFGIA